MAQAPTVDTSVPGLPGPGNTLSGLPGGGSSLLGTRLVPGVARSSTCRAPGEFWAAGLASRHPRGFPRRSRRPGLGRDRRTCRCRSRHHSRSRSRPTSAPFSGTLEIRRPGDEGPADGVTLDQAIDVTLERSLDLRQSSTRSPWRGPTSSRPTSDPTPSSTRTASSCSIAARARQFSRAAPGGPSQFDTNITYPLDVSHKRQARTIVATRAERVLEAQYQDAVRNRIDDVYGAYVTALAARQTVRYATAERQGVGRSDGAEPEQLLEEVRSTQADLNLVEEPAPDRQAGRAPMPRPPIARPSSIWDRS